MSYIIIVLLTVTLSNGEEFDKIEIHDFKDSSMSACIKHKQDIISLNKGVKINTVYCVEAQ